jgi:hypothetical protein
MAINLPAFCDNQECGAVFPSGFVVDNAINITLSGNKCGPCPHCGGMGSILDGVFNFANNAIEIISAPQHTIDELSKLSKIITDAIKHRESGQIISDKISKEVPSLAKLGKIILGVGGGILLLLQIINSIIDIKKSSQNSLSPITINQDIVINQAVNNLYQENCK